MQINPSLILFLLSLSVFMPSIQDWATQGGTAWYRPYTLWLLAIIFVFWVQHLRPKKPLSRSEVEDQNSHDD
ncbi:MAG: hypothetical protein ACI9WS_003197 [Paraglaciecola psychrophila]|jgi:hypothetical protein